MFLHENNLRNFVLVCLGQYYTKQLPVQRRNSHQRCSVKKVFLKISQYSQENTVLEFLFNKVAGLQGCNFIEKKFHHRCFQVRFAKFLKTPILKNICKQLLLTMLAHSTQSSQCGPNMADTALHKKITGTMLVQTLYRSSHRRCFVKKCVLKNFVVLTGKHLC